MAKLVKFTSGALIALCYFFLILISAHSPLNAQNFLWAQKAGGTEFDFAYEVAVDAAGFSYVTGQIRGSVVIGTTTLVSAGGNDVFLAKYAPNGNMLWAIRGGGQDDDDVRAMITDKAGNSYLFYSFRSTTTFGATTLSAYDVSDHLNSDLALVKVNANGNVVWTKKVATGPANQGGYGVAVDDAGNCYLTGTTIQDAILGNITISNQGGLDCFIAKVDPSGNVVWAKGAGSWGNDAPRDIAIDAAGNCYITGSFHGTVSFGGLSVTSSGASDIFIAKYDANGNSKWAKSAGGLLVDEGRSLQVAPSGNIYVTGWFEGNAAFSGLTLNSSGDRDIFLARYDAAGNRIWLQKAGGSGPESGYSLALDAAENSFIAGEYGSSLATFGCSDISNKGLGDIFVAKYDPAGTNLWAASAGGAERDYATGISIDGSGNCYLAGQFKGDATFGTATLSSSSSSNDIFVAKLFSVPASIALTGGGSLCAGTASSVAFSVSCAVAPTEQFQVQLSEVNTSSFPVQPIVVGSGTSSPLAVTVPGNIPPGNYAVRVISSGGTVSNAVALFVTPSAQPTLTLQVSNPEPCAKEVVRVSAVSNEDNPQSFVWKVNGVAVGPPSNRDFLNLTAIPGKDKDSTYMISVEMVSSKPCTAPASAQTSITVYPPPVLTCHFPEMVEVGKSALLSLLVKDGVAPFLFTWTLEGLPNAIQTSVDTLSHTFTKSGIYRVTARVTDARGCQATCETVIKVEPSPSINPPPTINLPPNVFTPNGDGYNERFTIDYRGTEKFIMIIYNRWGKLVATTTDGIMGWDGADCSTGVYYYHIRVADREFKGWLSLLR